jgi:DNA-binding transcriptional LysR family regulator
MDRFQSIDTFVRVAETGSFAETARQLKVSKSVVTTRIQQLEDLVGVALFHRTTRHVRLSEVGEMYLHDCADLVSRSNELMDVMRESHVSPTGNLRIHALPGFVLERMAHLLSRFLTLYPDISIDLVVNDAVVDPVKEGFDCALQIFPPASEDLIERRLFPVRRVFCASPDYIKNHDPILRPEDLCYHSLGLYSRYPSKNHWVFNGKDEEVILDLEPSLQSNSIHMLRNFAEDGGGVVCVPTVVAADSVTAGDLKLLLCDYSLSYFWLSAVFPQTQRNMFKLRLFLDFLVDDFAGEPPWDTALTEYGLVIN